jgi:hypothetical protein
VAGPLALNGPSAQQLVIGGEVECVALAQAPVNSPRRNGLERIRDHDDARLRKFEVETILPPSCGFSPDLWHFFFQISNGEG